MYMSSKNGEIVNSQNDKKVVKNPTLIMKEM